MKPSKYQKAVLKELTSTDNNILVNSKAGSGKTTLLKMIVDTLTLNAIGEISILVLAFNKPIQLELAEKLNGKCDVRTCHSQGLRMLRSNRKVKIENKKKSQIIKRLQATKDDWKDLEADRLNVVSKLSDLCRLSLTNKKQDIKMLATKHDLDFYDEDIPLILELCKLMQNNRGIIDFVDMIFQAAIYPDLSFKKYDYVLIDECQDLNVCQQKIMLKCLKSGGRFIAVGDPAQAVYGFAGADSESFDKFRVIPNTVELPLNECYRCGKEIIKYVNTIEPEIEAFKKSPDGVVDDEAKLEMITQNDMVLCRTNLPLVILCYKYLGEGVKAYIKGKDIGEELANYVAKSRKVDVPEFLMWAKEDLHKLFITLSKIHWDKEDHEIFTLPSFLKATERLSILVFIIRESQITECEALKDHLKALFENDGTGICLSSIHKSKGLEADKVFILEPDNIRLPLKKAWQKVQERNLEYVAYTRAKSYLGFVRDWSSKAQAQAVENDVDFVAAITR